MAVVQERLKEQSVNILVLLVKEEVVAVQQGRVTEQSMNILVLPTNRGNRILSSGYAAGTREDRIEEHLWVQLWLQSRNAGGKTGLRCRISPKLVL